MDALQHTRNERNLFLKRDRADRYYRDCLLILRLQVTIDSVHGLLDSLDRGEAGNTARILVLESLGIQLRTLLSRWELLAIIAASCTSICSIRGLPMASHGSRGVGRPRYEISFPQLEFLQNRMRLTWSQITGKLFVSRTTLWRRVQNLEPLFYCYTTNSDAELETTNIPHR